MIRMKRFITKYAAYVILAVMLIMLIPGITNRISNEQRNNNVTVSVLYNQFVSTISRAKFDSVLEDFKAMGVNTVSVMEEDLNAMVNRGDVTSIRYHVLRHKYDDQSLRLADLLEERCPDIAYNSHIVIASREQAKRQLAYTLPRKYSNEEFCDVGEFEGLYIYVMYDGRKELFDYAVGYNEEVLSQLDAKGLNIALVYKVKNYRKTDYMQDINRIVKEYDVEYLNLKADPREYKEVPEKKDNYLDAAYIINENNMTLVVTENMDQLSNQRFMGYDDVFSKVMGEGGSKKVVRSYETQDDSQTDESKYKYRTEQFFNSTIDRNTRFVTVLPLLPEFTSNADCADYTVKATAEYVRKIENLGYTVNGETKTLDYKAHHTANAAICAIIMVMCFLLMYNMVSGKQEFKITVGAIILAVLAAAGTCVLPYSLIALYPTAFCVVQSCTAITAVLFFIKTQKDKLSYWVLAPASVFIMLAVLLLGAVGMGTMLSGIEYYVNNVIFRGIKISLIIPVLYTTLVYYLMFIKSEKASITGDLKKVMYAEIKVYWLLIAAVVGAVGVYYLMRSGNVNSISSLEKTLRSTVTEIFPARPRTKEFLIGYPALILFVYYMKNSNIQLIKWLLAIAASILAASITNSFCHMFTDFTVIVSRTLNGLVLGIIVAFVAFVANLILIKILKFAKGRLEI